MSAVDATTAEPFAQPVAMPMPIPAAAETPVQGETGKSALVAPEERDFAMQARKGSITVSDAGTTGTSVNLPREVVAKLEKTEAKEAKKVSKILQKEGKTSTMELSAAIKELSSLEKEHKKGVKGESSAQSASMKAAKKAHKLEVAYLKAKSKYEQAQADAEAKDGLLQTAKTHALTIHEKLQLKTKEVEEMRQQKAAGDRERSAKLEILKA